MESARARTDELFALLSPRAVYSRPVPERHRLIFYLGHLEAFDWNLICRKSLGIPSFHPQFDKLFEFGIDPPVGQAAQDQPADWPAVEEVVAYNRRVRRVIDDSLGQAPEQLIHVALEHRLMHAETFAYLIHNLPYDQKSAPPTHTQPVHRNHPLTGAMIEIPAGYATLGQKAGEFGWDNEFEQQRVHVPGFAVGQYKITNGEYLKFVEAGLGQAPHFWIRRGSDWFYRGMFSEIPLPPNAPVYVTHRQATAYASWAGKELLTEPQFHRAAYETPHEDERPYAWGNSVPEAIRGNFDFNNWDPVDVDATPGGDSAFGVSQLIGNGWEWTRTPFGPFQGFQPFPFYPGYSKNFFDEEHYVMKGASPRTAACFLRRSFRNWFRPDYPHVYTSFRLTDN
jgi:formylglycine-generating enzyme required for sulfatase activity